MTDREASVQLVSPKGEFCRSGLIDSAELARRWLVPESWIRNRTRARTPKDERIPCIRLGRYVRFDENCPRLQTWLDKRQK
jgi:hypothetical protein